MAVSPSLARKKNEARPLELAKLGIPFQVNVTTDVFFESVQSDPDPCHLPNCC